VEDAPDLRYLLVLVLTEAGYAVTAVATGRAALAALAQAPSIIICPI
jgi:CheY-like chemotaxis protein